MTMPYETKAITLYTSAVADTNGVLINCEGLATVCVQLAGTMANSTTVYWEGTVGASDGTYVGVLGWNRTTGVKALSTTAVGLFVINVTGLTWFRARYDFQTGASTVTATAKGTSIPLTTLVTAT